MPDTVAAVSDGTRELPEDFGRRVRAAAGYMGLGMDRFAEEVDRAGASGSTMKAWGRGQNLPRPLTRESLIKRLAEVSGLPEEFFWGAKPVDPAFDSAAAGALQNLSSSVDALRQEIQQGRRETNEQLSDLAKAINSLDFTKAIQQAFDDYAARLGERIGKLPPRSKRKPDPRAEEPPAAA